MKKKIAFISFIFCLCTAVIVAANDPVAMLRTTADKAIAELIKNKGTMKSNPSVVYSIIQRIMLPVMDKEGMARSALGREAWQSCSPAQQKQFVDQFVLLLVRTYSSALAQYTDETIEFLPPRDDSGRTIEVGSRINQKGGPAIPVVYYLVNKGGQWRVYDMNVEGVSLIQSFRSQFSNIYETQGFDALMNSMVKHNKGLKSE